MRVFVTGANGFVGSAVVAELIASGHHVTGLVRSDAAAARVAAAGAEIVRGAIEDREVVARAVAAADGVIHTAYNHDFVNVSREAAGEADRQLIEAVGDVLAGSNRPFVITSGIGVLGGGRTFTEDDAPDPSSGTAHRLPSERAALALAARGVRSAVIRLSPSVHGDGDYAFVPIFIRIARAKRVSAYVDDGANRWPAVHRLDAAVLYRLAVERAPAGSVLHGVGDPGIPLREIAGVIGARLGIPVQSLARAAAAAHFGWIAGFAQLDAPASSAKTQDRLGWQLRHPGLLADLEHGRYFD